MTIDKKYVDQIINVTSKAAIASSFLVGKKDKIAADQAAVDSMRQELNKINMRWSNNLIAYGSLYVDHKVFWQKTTVDWLPRCEERYTAEKRS